MTLIRDCPFGFEDGHILGYRAESLRLEVDFEFWNEKRGTLTFVGYIGSIDRSSIRVTVSAVTEKRPSDFVDSLIGRLYEQPPSETHWTHFQFLDLDDQPMFEVVAELCSFHAQPYL